MDEVRTDKAGSTGYERDRIGKVSQSPDPSAAAPGSADLLLGTAAAPTSDDMADVAGEPRPDGARGRPESGARPIAIATWSVIAADLRGQGHSVVLIGSGLAWATYQNFTNSVPHWLSARASGSWRRATRHRRQGHGHPADRQRQPGDATAAELQALGTQDDGGSVNTDTMMVLHVPANGSRATIISFPRDSWVTIPGHGKGKINSAYSIGYKQRQRRGRRASRWPKAPVRCSPFRPSMR